MSEPEKQFAELMDRVKGGSEDAVRELLDLYGEYIYRVIRRRLHRHMRTQFDSQDFAQAVWASFFAKRDEFDRFETPDELLAFLQAVAGNKVIEECRRLLRSSKNNVNLERTLEQGFPAGDEPAPFASDPTPSEIVSQKERTAQVFNDLPSNYQPLVEMRLGGATFREIAKKMGLNERTVRRVFKRLGQRLIDDNSN